VRPRLVRPSRANYPRQHRAHGTSEVSRTHDFAGRGADPTASILLIGYYQVIPTPKARIVGDGSSICDDLAAAVPGSQFRTGIYNDAQALLAALNKTIGDAAARAHVGFVDLTTVFQGHRMCSSSNGSGGSSRIFTQDWRAVHPTVPGQQEIAARVEATCATEPCMGS